MNKTRPLLRVRLSARLAGHLVMNVNGGKESVLEITEILINACGAKIKAIRFLLPAN